MNHNNFNFPRQNFVGFKHNLAVLGIALALYLRTAVLSGLNVGLDQTSETCGSWPSANPMPN